MDSVLYFYNVSYGVTVLMHMQECIHFGCCGQMPGDFRPFICFVCTL